MGIREVTNSGAFAVTILTLVVLFVPFGLEQIGEATGLFEFPVTKTVRSWFDFGRDVLPHGRAAPAVDWSRYRKDLEVFTKWVEGQSDAVIRPSVEPVVIKVVENDQKHERRLWTLPIASCTAGDAAGRAGSASRTGYVFISGIDHPFREGAVIAPSEELCGYEIVFIGERSVWLRAVFESEGDVPMGKVKFPEFTRVEGDSLVRGKRKYAVRDAFPLVSGGWLMLHSFLPPDGAVFKILDEKRIEVATILCIVIGEKGGK